jgi:nitrogen regulatory protein P-II 1
MKRLVAVIQPDKLPDVKKALLEAHIPKMTVSNVIGAGEQKGYSESYRGAIYDVNLLKKVRVEVVLKDAEVKTAVDAIIKAARTGKIGDGKIFISPVEEVIKIRTGEKGDAAV